MLSSCHVLRFATDPKLAQRTLVRMYTAAEQRLQACTNGTVTKPVTQSSDFNFIGEQLKVLEQQLSTLKNEL